MESFQRAGWNSTSQYEPGPDLPEAPPSPPPTPFPVSAFTSLTPGSWVQSRPLKTHELRDPLLSAAIATKMAKFHGMEMPFTKEPHWLFGTMDRYLKQIQDLPPTGLPQMNLLEMYSLKDEMGNLRKLLDTTPSPVVFCHNDIQEGNILLLSEPKSTDSLMLVDFEYSSYNYRGFDIGNHFCEWVYDYTHEEWPFYKAQPANYPTQGQQLHFIRHYLAEVKKDETVSQEEQRKMEADLLVEANRYALASHFFWGLWSILQASMSTIEFGYLVSNPGVCAVSVPVLLPAEGPADQLPPLVLTPLPTPCISPGASRAGPWREGHRGGPGDWAEPH
ncbi:choline/ethanolamine kinase isoform X4 [Cervus elaphus]|uniref:choline/ethanolamine kinase isoform X4 n=1 Tax=Cervus elaphus TaxID=9860 RepID=UPI001CC29FC3|nr:choline/ethanolamine kinase isoform X4 [Cervus elaphus]XP_043737405.1 choline/ethanolamine kinase isoform X4 [Cervus elaphus]